MSVLPDDIILLDSVRSNRQRKKRKTQDKVEPLDKQLVEERPMKRNRQNVPPLDKIPPSPSVASRAKRYGKRARASPVPAAPREDFDEPPKLAAHQKIKSTAMVEAPIRKIIMKGKDGKSNMKSVPTKSNAKLKEKKPLPTTDKGIAIKTEPVVNSLDVPFSLRTSVGRASFSKLERLTVRYHSRRTTSLMFSIKSQLAVRRGSQGLWTVQQYQMFLEMPRSRLGRNLPRHPGKRLTSLVSQRRILIFPQRSPVKITKSNNQTNPIQ